MLPQSNVKLHRPWFNFGLTLGSKPFASCSDFTGTLAILLQRSSPSCYRREERPQILKAAQSYVCTACAKYKKPADAAPSSLPQSTTFNQQLQADIFWVRRGSVKYAILSIVDVATRYTAARLVKSEQSEELIKALSVVGLPCLDLLNSSSLMKGGPGLDMTSKTGPASTEWITS